MASPNASIPPHFHAMIPPPTTGPGGMLSYQAGPYPPYGLPMIDPVIAGMGSQGQFPYPMASNPLFSQIQVSSAPVAPNSPIDGSHGTGSPTAAMQWNVLPVAYDNP
ncbi:hypothetical protein DL93DRAFT_2086937 [Clavulina sp. PMI_390]|nr:hypothetical protein DL93DRAFT_2086937 [Clavulina sp. PMI_390]